MCSRSASAASRVKNGMSQPFHSCPFENASMTTSGGSQSPPEVVIDAFSNGQLWNGWLIPFFTLEAALALREHMPELYYSEATDQFCLQGDEPQWCGATDLTIDGKV